MNYRLKTSLFSFIGALALLTSCVTTTTGGFSVEPSSQRALEDYIQLAAGYFDANDMAGARRHINNALKIDDGNSQIYNILALVHEREGDLGLAESSFRRALNLDRNNSRARNNFAAFLFSSEQFEEAVEQLEIVTTDTNYLGRSVAFENLGYSALRIPDDEKAVDAFKRALQIDGNMYRSALELTQLYIDKNDFGQANNYYNRFLSTTAFYNIVQTPQSLWIGIQLEKISNDKQAATTYAIILKTLFQNSPEYQLYESSLNE